MDSTVVTQFEPTDWDSLAEELVSAVAAAEDTDPVALRPRLYDAVNPDVLPKLFEQSRTDVTITFSYGGRQVQIEDGVVTVTRNAEAEPAIPGCQT